MGPDGVVEVLVDVVSGGVVAVVVDVVVVAPADVVPGAVAGFEEVVDDLVVVRVRGLATGVGDRDEGCAPTGSRTPVNGAD